MLLPEISYTCSITACQMNTTHISWEKTVKSRWRGCRGVVGTLLWLLCLLGKLPGRTHKHETAAPRLTSENRHRQRRGCLSQASGTNREDETWSFWGKKWSNSRTDGRTPNAAETFVQQRHLPSLCALSCLSWQDLVARDFLSHRKKLLATSRSPYLTRVQYFAPALDFPWSDEAHPRRAWTYLQRGDQRKSLHF